MATDKLKQTSKKLEMRSASVSYSCSPNGGQFNANLKTIVDNALASGERCLGVVGFTTNDTSIVPISFNYSPSAYSLQLRNLASSTVSGTCTFFYLVETA